MSIRHTEMINRIIASRGYGSYLEIGLGSGTNFARIAAGDKTGVDPAVPERARRARPRALELFAQNSDEFFAHNRREFDFIFIDGMHERHQVLRDTFNALRSLRPGGAVMLHDCNPPSEDAQRMPRAGRRVWCGDVWKAWVEMRVNARIHQVCIAEDYGCGLLWPGKQDPMLAVPLTYPSLDSHREEWLNLIGWNDYERVHLQR